MPSGKKDQDLQGINQISNIRRQNIVDFEIIASKLNGDVAGNGITLNPITNKIEIIGATVVQDSAGLTGALASGNTTVLLLDGTYVIPQISVTSGTLRLVGSSKDGTIIQLPPSGTISVNHVSGQTLTGYAAINTTLNPGVAYLSGMVSGQMPQFSWIGASLVIDDIPYGVNRVVSGELSGIAQIELTEAYTGPTFTSKPFRLQYLINGFALSNMTVTSASDSGIIDIKRAKYALIDNVIIKGANVLTRATSGLRLTDVYLSSFSDIGIINTKWTSSIVQDKYAAEIVNVHYSSFYDIYIYNCKSHGLLINGSSYLSFNILKYANIDGGAFSINNSNELEVSSAHLTRTLLTSSINNSDNIYVSDSFSKNETPTQLLDVFNSSVVLNDNASLINSWIRIRSNKDTIIAGNSFQGSGFIDSMLYIHGLGRALVTGNNFDGTSGNQAMMIDNGRAIINSNFIDGASAGVKVVSGSIVRLANNVIENVTSGIIYDVTVTKSVLDNNTVTAATNALTVFGTGNYISNNTILSGSAVIASGNIFSILSNLQPIFSGIIDIGSEDNPFNDAYVNGTLHATNVIAQNMVANSFSTKSSFTVSGNLGVSGNVEIAGYFHVSGDIAANSITLSGHVITAASGTIYVDGQQITGSGGGGSSGGIVLSGTLQAFPFTQSTSSTTWTINHGLNTTSYSLTLFDSSGFIFLPFSARAVTPNQIVVTFSSPQTGAGLVIGDISASAPQLPAVQYVHTQAVAATTWSVTHNQNSSDFDVTVFDQTAGSGTVYLPLSIDIVDNNRVTINNSIATKGKAVFIFANATPIVASGAVEYVHTQTFASTTWNVNHTLGSTSYVINVFDESGFVVIPENIQTISTSSVSITFPYAARGTAVLVGQAPGISTVQQSNYKFTQAVAANTWTIAHNLNTTDFVIDTFDSSGNMFIPSGIVILDANNIQVNNTSPRAGKAIVQFQNAIINPATSGAIYVHSQATNSTIWTINHAQNSRNFIINTFNQSGSFFLPDGIDIIDSNTVQVSLPFAISGTAVLAFRTGVTPSAPPQNMYVYTQAVSGLVWNIAHNLNTSNYSITTFDQSGAVYLPNSIVTLDSNNIQVVNPIPKIGKAVIIFQNANIAPYNATQFTFLQGTAASTWNINHNLRTTQFNISTFDVSGFYFLPDDIRIIDDSNVQITSVTPIAGTATLTFQNANVSTFMQGARFEQRTAVASGVIVSGLVFNRVLPLTFLNGADRGKAYQISLDGTGPLTLDTTNTARDNDYYEVQLDATDGFNTVVFNQPIVGPANIITWAPGLVDGSSYAIQQLTNNSSRITSLEGGFIRVSHLFGFGSTNTKIPYFGRTDHYIGTDVIYQQSTVLGDSFLVMSKGIYTIGAQVIFNSATRSLIVTANATDFTSNPDTTIISGTIASSYPFATGQYSPALISVTKPLNVGDVIRMHSNSDSNFREPYWFFSIYKERGL